MASTSKKPDDLAVLRLGLVALLEKCTPLPWSWKSIAEKSNEFAIGQAFDANGQPIAGRIPEGEWIEETVIERRGLVGMNESGHANFADAELIVTAINALPALLDAIALRAAPVVGGGQDGLTDEALKAVAEVIGRYGGHDDDCHYRVGDESDFGLCDCGFHEAGRHALQAVSDALANTSGPSGDVKVGPQHLVNASHEQPSPSGFDSRLVHQPSSADVAETSRAVDLGPHPDCSCKGTSKPCPCRWSLDPLRIALDRAARINAADETLRKGLKLIEAMLEPCETPNSAVDHAWRQCRRCLAAAELDSDNRETYEPLLRAVLLAALASSRPAAPVLPVEAQVIRDIKAEIEDCDRMLCSIAHGPERDICHWKGKRTGLALALKHVDGESR